MFLRELTLEENIARNQALKENVFMMVVCIELRIPLFLVGKPGSSKSLAKTIVADAMQGDTSRSELYKQFKSVRLDFLHHTFAVCQLHIRCSPQHTCVLLNEHTLFV